MFRRSSIGLLTALFLFSIPALAADPPAPACTKLTAAIVGDGPLGGAPTLALEPEERLLYDHSDLAASTIEVRFRVDGETYVTEIADLGAARLPLAKRLIDGPEPIADARAGGPRVIELLSLRPDVARRLHANSRLGRRVEVEIAADGATVDAVSLRGMVERSARLRRADARPLVLRTEVTGPGAFYEPVSLDKSGSGCGTCGPTVPCDADGPYDEGKGDCVQCAEIGDCDPGPCDCETILREYWGNWYVTNVVPLGSYGCIDWTFQPDERGSYVRATYRRNRIRDKYVCPNCPACNGCYTTQEVISFETQDVYCYAPLNQSCFAGDPWVPQSSVCP